MEINFDSDMQRKRKLQFNFMIWGQNIWKVKKNIYIYKECCMPIKIILN